VHHPADALARHEAGQFFIIFHHPHLRGSRLLPMCRPCCRPAPPPEEPLWTSCPRAGLLAGHEARYVT
jgi:recombination protein RecT